MIKITPHLFDFQFIALRDVIGNFFHLLYDRLAQEGSSELHGKHNVVMGFMGTMVFTLQGHAFTLLENHTVFKLSLQGTLRQDRRVSGNRKCQFHALSAIINALSKALTPASISSFVIINGGAMIK